MTELPAHPSSDDARRQLDEADRLSLASDHDRRVYAVTVAALGLVLGGFVATMPSFVLPTRGGWLLLGGVVVVLVAVGWVQRRVGTTPLRATRTQKVAGVSMALVGPVLLTALADNGVITSWWARSLMFAAYAVPFCVAAALISRDEG